MAGCGAAALVWARDSGCGQGAASARGWIAPAAAAAAALSAARPATPWALAAFAFMNLFLLRFAIAEGSWFLMYDFVALAAFFFIACCLLCVVESRSSRQTTHNRAAATHSPTTTKKCAYNK